MKLTLQEVFFFLILIFISIGFYKVIEPFFTDVFLTIVIAILFRRPFEYFVSKTNGKKTLASFITIFLVIFILAIPLTLIGIMLTSEVSDTYFMVREGLPSIRIKIYDIYMSLKEIPYIGDRININDLSEIQNTIDDGIKKLAEIVVSLIQSMFINLTSVIIHFFVVLFLLFYTLLDGDKLLQKVQYLVPLNDKDETELFDKLKQVTDAIVFNTFMIATIEGSYSAILFAIVGIPSPVFWGIIMVVLSLIPLVGANTILVPAVIILFSTGNVSGALILLIFGVGVIIINQNIVRPRLDGHKSGMHPAIVFLASMGGLIWMGIVGFVAGPMITAVFMIIWNQFGEHYKEKLEKYNKG